MEQKLDLETKAIREEIKSTSTEIKSLKVDLKDDLIQSIRTGIAEAVGDQRNTMRI